MAQPVVSPLSAPRAGARITARFGIVTDAHYADLDPYEGRHCRESLAKMTECADAMRRAGVDFVIELGDLVNGAPSGTLDRLREIEAVFATCGAPRYHVLGNHDMESLSKAQVLSAVDNTGIARGQTFYAFDRAGLHVVVLDACFRSDGADYDSGNFDWRDTLIPAGQVDWLDRDLAHAHLPVIVCAHQLLAAGGGEHAVRNAREVRRVIEASGRVLAVLQGHLHAGGASVDGGIAYYTLRAMCEGAGPANSAYAVVEVLDDGSVEVNGARAAASMVMPGRSARAA